MKVYLIAENHARDENDRKMITPRLLSTEKYMMGREGMFIGFVGEDGTHGLDDVLYDIYTEVAAAYIAACQGDGEGIDTAFGQLRGLFDFLNREEIRDEIDIIIRRPPSNEKVSVKSEVIAQVRSHIDGYKPEELPQFIEATLNLLIYLKGIIYAYVNNDDYLGVGQTPADKDFPALDIEKLRTYNTMTNIEKDDFGNAVLGGLRNIPLVCNIGNLMKMAQTDGKNLVIIMGEEHVNTPAFTFPLMRACFKAEVPISIHVGYRRLMEELEDEAAHNRLILENAKLKSDNENSKGLNAMLLARLKSSTDSSAAASTGAYASSIVVSSTKSAGGAGKAKGGAAPKH